MKRQLFTLAVISAFASLPGEARDITTPASRRDLAERISLQPTIASTLADRPAAITPDERQALDFLYAYMPTADALDYDVSFWLDNVRASLKAAEEMPWGKTVPDREWRHFVLPVRVNNENLDMSRTAFYDELKDRVKGLSMADAILEVNHWCHEKVSYQPSDGRTSAPLATVCNALGRCGEESTFTVAALRSVGIPARQVYTPRWAHTDDNHAWVEAWADGRWHFLGACEPEAVLDLAWFNAPASRGMLMNTNVTGAYDGPEEVLDKTPMFTSINVTANYAPTDTALVTVVGTDGRPVENAKVNFSLYNYSEFYALAVKTTGPDGKASLTTGKGDMLVWASDGTKFGLLPYKGEPLRIVLDKDASFAGATDFDLVPPPAGAGLPEVSPEAAALNDRRKQHEDSIRNAYVATFISPSQAGEICARLGLPDKGADILVKSRGNHRTITGFLESIPQGARAKAIDMLGAVNEKDLHDLTADVLADHLATPVSASPLFIRYILNPRVEYEMLTPYKAYFSNAFSESEKKAYAASPAALEKRFADEIAIDNAYAKSSYRISPRSVWEGKTADPLSRSIAFVAACRSLGIPARINPVSHATQYADAKGEWHDCTFGEKQAAPAGKKGLVVLSDVDRSTREPKYFSQFSIARIDGGRPTLLEFDEFIPVSAVNARKEPFDPGQYVLVTGQRLADGSVLARTQFFNVEAGATADVPLQVRQDTTSLQVIGSLNAELLYRPLDGGEPRSILSTTGRGYYVLGLIAPGHEPSAHAVNDIAVAADELEATGRKLLLIFPDADSASRYKAADYGRLPSNVEFGVDVDGAIADGLVNGLELPGRELPIVVVADTFNRIVFARQGYTINLGHQLHRVLESVE